MGAEIKNLFFVDKLRGIVSLLGFVLLLAAIGGSWLFPKETKIDAEQIKAIVEATESIKKAAQGMEQLNRDNAVFKEGLRSTFGEQFQLRDKNYGDLMDMYGPPKGLSLPGTAGQRPPDGVQQPAHAQGWHGLPPRPGNPSGAQQLQHPTDDSAEKPRRSVTGVSGGNSLPATEQGGGSGNVPREQ